MFLCYSGIGKETARDLHRRGARIILACRNTEDAQKAANDIEARNAKFIQGNGELVVAKLDLSSLASVRAFAQNIIESEERVDILINNAGTWSHPSTRSETKDGFEQTIGVNHFGPFLLTNLLTDKMAHSPELPSRIINVASRAHERGEIKLDDINSEKEYNGFAAYSQSKLANILFTNELSEKLKDKNQDVSVYSLHPGVIYTNLYREFDQQYGLLVKIGCAFVWPFLKSSKEGAQTTIYCATEESLAPETGKYYCDCAEKYPSPHALDKDTAAELWEMSEKLVGLK